MESLFNFARRMSSSYTSMRRGNLYAVRQAGQFLERKSREVMGVGYDYPGNGTGGGSLASYDPRSPWPALADPTMSERAAKGFAPDQPLLRDGTLRDSIHFAEEETPGGVEGVVGSDDPRMVWAEIGTVRQPSRPVIGGTAVRNQDRIEAIMTRGLVGNVFNFITGRRP